MPAEVGEPTHGSKCRSCGASDLSIRWISNDQIVAVANFEREGIPAADDLRHALAFEAVLSSKHPSQEPLRKCGKPRNRSRFRGAWRGFARRLAAEVIPRSMSVATSSRAMGTRKEPPPHAGSNTVASFDPARNCLAAFVAAAASAGGVK